MPRPLKTPLIVFLSLCFAYIFAPQSGRFYEKIIGHRISGNWIGTCPECYEGFMIIFPLIVAFLSLIFFDDIRRIKRAIYLSLISPSLLIIARQGDTALLALSAGLIGFILGHLFYLIRQKYFSSRPDKKQKIDNQ